jgi:hypothetical protein
MIAGLKHYGKRSMNSVCSSFESKAKLSDRPDQLILVDSPMGLWAPLPLQLVDDNMTITYFVGY